MNSIKKVIGWLAIGLLLTILALSFATMARVPEGNGGEEKKVETIEVAVENGASGQSENEELKNGKSDKEECPYALCLQHGKKLRWMKSDGWDNN